MLTEKSVSAVIASYKEEENIPELYAQLTAALQRITPHYEIVYVLDGNPDRSFDILRAFAEKDPHLTVVLLSRNFGEQNAFSAGLRQATGDAVVLLNGDLQDPPELISTFVEKWKEGYDVVYGVHRVRERSMGKLLAWIYHLFYVFIRSHASIDIPLDAGEFSLMDRKVVDRMSELPETDRYVRCLRAWVGFPQTGIDYVRAERFRGKTHYNLRKIFNVVKGMFFSFSDMPVRWISYGAVLSVIASFIAGIIFILHLFFPVLPTTVAASFLLLIWIGSAQFVAISVLAEYLVRTFHEVKARPSYIVQEILNDHRKS